MFFHNLKIALRNMRKYINQTLISVIGLAVGFTCFSLAMLWVRYEMTYDSFHRNSKQLYVVYTPSTFSPTGYITTTYNPMAAHLKETFPEVADAISLNPNRSSEGQRQRSIFVDGAEIQALVIKADSNFFRMFDVKILEGSREFLIPGSNKMAISYGKARQLFGNDNPIGKTINNGANEICAIVSDMSKRSNYAFDFIEPFFNLAANPVMMWNVAIGDNAIIELVHGTNVEDFEKKLFEHNTGEGRRNITGMKIIPITKLRYTDPSIARNVKFQHVLIFALSGLLVILCSLLNYLTLFVSRFRIRQKELALRMVCGASGASLLAMLSVEFILTMLIAVTLGIAFTKLAYAPYIEMSEIQMLFYDVYQKSFIYVAGVIFISLMAFWMLFLKSASKKIRIFQNDF